MYETPSSSFVSVCVQIVVRGAVLRHSWASQSLRRVPSQVQGGGLERTAIGQHVKFSTDCEEANNLRGSSPALHCTAVAVTTYWSKEDSVWTIITERHSPPLVVSLQDGKGTPSLCMSAPLQTSVCLSSSPCIMLLVVLVSDKHHTVFSSKCLVILSFLLSFSNCCVHVRITSWACGELGLKPQNMLRGITLASLRTFENISWTLLRNDSVMIMLL